jgi:hypothetical protein
VLRKFKIDTKYSPQEIFDQMQKIEDRYFMNTLLNPTRDSTAAINALKNYFIIESKRERKNGEDVRYYYIKGTNPLGLVIKDKRQNDNFVFESDGPIRRPSNPPPKLKKN